MNTSLVLSVFVAIIQLASSAPDATNTTTGNTTTTTTTACTKQTHHPRCSTTHFCLLQTCCKTARNDLFVVDPKDKSCAHPDAKPFNSYLLNRLQNRRESFTVDFTDPIVQRALIEDAITGGAFQASELQAFVTKRNPTDPWKTYLSGALSTCLNNTQVNSAPDFVHHKQVCSGKALALMQCTLLKSLDLCERNMDRRCAPYWQEFDKCKSQVFPK